MFGPLAVCHRALNRQEIMGMLISVIFKLYKHCGTVWEYDFEHSATCKMKAEGQPDWVH